MSTLRINNIEAKSVPASPTIDEKIKLTNSSGDVLVHVDGKTSGITTIGINTTAGNITFDANSNVVVTGIITATKFVGTIEPTDLNVSGRLLLGTTTEGHPAADELTIANTANAADMGITLRSATNGQGAIYFSDGTSGDAEYRGIINYNHTSDFLNFYTAAAARLKITSTGNVGINENNPSRRLDVSGDILGNAFMLKGNTSASPSIQAQMFRPANNTLAFATNGNNERLRITSDGKVSIGNLTSPDSLLHIHNGSAGSIAASSSANLTIESDGSYNVLQFLSPHTAEQQVRFGDNSDNGKGYIAYNHGSDYLAIGVGGPERFRIASTGLHKITQPGNITDGSYFSTVTISSPNGTWQRLRFDRGSVAKWGIGMKNDDTFQIVNLFQNGSVSANDNTLRITDNNNISMVGKLGIQVLSPLHELDLGGVATNQDDGSEYTLRIRSNHNKTAIRIGGGGGGSRVALMRFDGDSNPGSGVGCSGDTDKSAYGGTLVYHGDRSGNENSFAVYMDQSANANQIEAFNIRQNGDYMHGGSSYSDRDQKENITAISGTALDKITQLSPKTWNWKPEYHDIPTDRIFAGFIAQEVQPHIPSIVTGTDGQGDMALDYQGLLAWTIKAVTELNSKVDTLEQENTVLKSRISALEP